MHLLNTSIPPPSLSLSQNGDGLISLNDFVECSKRDPIIVKSLALFDGLC